MTRGRSSRLALLVPAGVLVCLALSACAHGNDRQLQENEGGRQAPRLWGSLAPGPYAVGFKVLFALDRSRPWKVTRRYGQPFAPDGGGRPVRVELWYPAAKATGTSMHYRDYIETGAPKGFAAAQEILQRRDQLIASLSVPPERLGELTASPVFARRDAAPAGGRFPLVIHFPGLDDAQALNVFVMAEYLASHGYVVATVSLLGINEDDPDQHRTPAGLEATLRDAEFAWGMLRNEKFVDPAKLASTGHSLGAIEALLLAGRNPNVSVVVGMDGTYGFAGATPVLTGFYDYSPRNISSALLDLRKDSNQQQTVLDLTALDAMALSDRAFITIDHMHHSDFTSFAVVAKLFNLSDSYTAAPSEHPWSRDTGYAGYLLACEMVKDYLDSRFGQTPDASARLQADVARAPGGTYRHLAGADVPPSSGDFLRMMHERGLDATVAFAKGLATTIPMQWVVPEGTFNSYGYQLLNTKHAEDAVAVFRLNLEAHPSSANAADSLADGYVGTGDVQKAIESYQKAIDLLPNDPAFDANGKQSFAEEERQKITRLRAAAK